MKYRPKLLKGKLVALIMCISRPALPCVFGSEEVFKCVHTDAQMWLTLPRASSVAIGTHDRRVSGPTGPQLPRWVETSGRVITVLSGAHGPRSCMLSHDNVEMLELLNVKTVVSF